MRVWAYCCASFATLTRRIVGREPLTCPPMRAEDFDPLWLAGEADAPHDLIYFDLHGRPGDAAWYGDERICAVTAEQVRSVRLRGATVFATNCYLADLDSPMLDALLDAGARYVIAGPGENPGGVQTMMGASLLGQQFVRMFAITGGDALLSLHLAKGAVRVMSAGSRAVGMAAQDAANADALEFRAFYRKAED